MIVLCFSMQGEVIFEHTNDKCHLFAFYMQDEGILEHTNGKCPKILVSALEHQVS
jgi:hypothetical protein